MLELFTLPFLQRALMAAVLIGLLGAVLGVFVILKRMAFFSDAVSHSAFAGIALGLLIGLDPTYTALAVAVAVGFGITYLVAKSHLAHDTVIGVFFSATLAAGVIIISLLQGYRADLFGLLFGDVLAVRPLDVLVLWVLTALVFLVLAIRFRPFLLMTFNPALAHVAGVRVAAHEYLLTFLVALAVGVGLKVVGVLLISAVLIVPAAAAKIVSRTLPQLFGNAALFGVIGGAGGLALSTGLNVAAGPAIVVVLTAIFILALLFRHLWKA